MQTQTSTGINIKKITELLFPAPQPMAAKITDEVELPAQVEETTETGEFRFSELTPKQKRFHLLFYTLAGLTGLVVVQLIWQIAILTK